MKKYVKAKRTHLKLQKYNLQSKESERMIKYENILKSKKYQFNELSQKVRLRVF